MAKITIETALTIADRKLISFTDRPRTDSGFRKYFLN